MAKASEKITTLTVRGEGGAVWEVDDTDAIRGLIDAGHLTVAKASQTRTGAATDAGVQGRLAPQEG